MAFTTLLVSNFRVWLSARGFLIVVAATLLPMILTGAWAATHQKDVAVTDVSWDASQAVDGTDMVFNATFVNRKPLASGPFNFTLHLLRPTAQGTFAEEAVNKTRIDNLGGNEARTAQLEWTAETGLYVLRAVVDDGNELPESAKENNEILRVVEVRNQPADPSQSPQAPSPLSNQTATTNADLVVENLRWTPELLGVGGNATFTATVRNLGPDPVENVPVTVRVGQVFSGRLFPFSETSPPRTVSLAAGATMDVTHEWRNLPDGAYWVEAFVNATNANDPNVTNNYVNQSFTVDPRVPEGFKFPDPLEKQTIKLFYLDIMTGIMVPLVFPLIGLFFAAGVLEDERERGNLIYILTRPVPRWMIPLLRFLVSFAVAAAAAIVGIVATYLFLLGVPEGNDVGLLSTPLLVSLITLFAYGSFFTLLGVIVDRPYLTGLAFIAWEWLVAIATLVQINDRPVVAEWVTNLTLSKHLVNAVNGWPWAEGWKWLPGAEGIDALRNLAMATLAFILVSCVIMKMREFEV